MTSRRHYVIKLLNFDFIKRFSLFKSIIPPNFVAISLLLQELYSLKDHDVMTSRRHYVIKISNFDPTKSFFLFQSMIPPNFVVISQLLRELQGLQDYNDYDVMTSRRRNVIEIGHHFYFLPCTLVHSINPPNLIKISQQTKKFIVLPFLSSKMT